MIPTRRRIKILVKLSAVVPGMRLPKGSSTKPRETNRAWTQTPPSTWDWGAELPDPSKWSWKGFKKGVMSELFTTGNRPGMLPMMFNRRPNPTKTVRPLQALMATSKVGPAVVKTQRAVGTGKRLTGAVAKAVTPGVKSGVKYLAAPVAAGGALAYGTSGLRAPSSPPAPERPPAPKAAPPLTQKKPLMPTTDTAKKPRSRVGTRALSTPEGRQAFATYRWGR